MADSQAFFQLDARIQRYLWAEGWDELRDAQERAIPLILGADQDVIIAAATASGKTEAAFLPALTHLLRHEPVTELIVYVSPLKALINDQFARLLRLCEQLEISVWPWHGDISSHAKQKFWKSPTGVLLITPESLEAMLDNRGSMIAGAFTRTAYFVIDELHAFLGTERGKQLQSLMHRIEGLLDRRVPRIALSATLGDMRQAAAVLRPGAGDAVALVESTDATQDLRLALKGYEEPDAATLKHNVQEGSSESAADLQSLERVADDLFRTLLGSNNLVFPNRRDLVELLTYRLSERCAQEGRANEFWPHHGSLSKELREETEAALKQSDRPATAICTTTLELGIDIGAVKSVAQVGVPFSVAGLRQRLGRSGRRKGEPAILRAHIIEEAVTAMSDLESRLRLETVQTTAMILLLLDKWYEPPVVGGQHLSTLVQQLLALIAQYGGVMAPQAFRLLCGTGAPFEGLDSAGFIQLLKGLGDRDLIMQDATGLLLHGAKGEAAVNHYSFYAAFATDEEYRLLAGTRVLGSMPVNELVTVGQLLIFGGRTWKVEDIDEERKTISVTPSRIGKPPLFGGGSGRVHTRVRERMHALLSGSEDIPFLDVNARRFLAEGRKEYAAMGLETAQLLDRGKEMLLLTWLGDSENLALACWLGTHGYQAWSHSLGVEIVKDSRPVSEVFTVLRTMTAEAPPDAETLLAAAKNLASEKWDWALPEALLKRSYASLRLNVAGAAEWLNRFNGPTS